MQLSHVLLDNSEMPQGAAERPVHVIHTDRRSLWFVAQHDGPETLPRWSRVDQTHGVVAVPTAWYDVADGDLVNAFGHGAQVAAYLVSRFDHAKYTPEECVVALGKEPAEADGGISAVLVGLAIRASERKYR